MWGWHGVIVGVEVEVDVVRVKEKRRRAGVDMTPHGRRSVD